MIRVVFVAFAASLVSCGGTTTCGPVECASVCEAAAPDVAPGLVLSDFEKSLLEPLLAETRLGVRPFSEASVGICKGSTRECTEYVGTDVGELPEGEYSVHAHLAVPDVGPKGTWKISFESSCDTIRLKDDGTEVRTTQKGKPREYDAIHSGEGRPFSLAPLRRIESPAKNGRQECTYVLRTLHPDNPQEFKGSWSVPAAP
jgi:hypothetical protein